MRACSSKYIKLKTIYFFPLLYSLNSNNPYSFVYAYLFNIYDLWYTYLMLICYTLDWDRHFEYVLCVCSFAVQEILTHLCIFLISHMGYVFSLLVIVFLWNYLLNYFFKFRCGSKVK
ncbi:hypothetical protein CDL12_18261 [Handroanthus impetiginosus]|uniref:Uncharacterized protein n=1 Tax=Handroanthus impetiginosus TaxID=429701 RepID=A0A2G9GV39_9LAMI|nr:hypothetical protein CDL12_18261 [Handroanthus impetiginosus]